MIVHGILLSFCPVKKKKIDKDHDLFPHFQLRTHSQMEGKRVRDSHHNFQSVSPN